MSNAVAPYPVHEAVALSENEKGAGYRQKALWLMLVGAAGIPVSLLWDYSWECTIGVDLFWGPPHAAIYLSVLLTGIGAIAMLGRNAPGIRFGPWTGPFGAWLTLWGVAAFASTLLFERWWQGAYGLSAGIWHPPQICKA